MKKVIPFAFMLSMGAYAAYDTNNATKKFENYNERQEYSYETFPDTKFWYEDGRSYWAEEAPTQSVSTVISAPIAPIKTAKVNWDIPTTIERNILFPNDQYELTQSGKAYLNKISKELKENSNDIVVIVGHASAPGTKAYNKRLSKNRALTVKSYLMSTGLPIDMFKVKYEGESEPLATLDESRRVELRVEKYSE